MKKTHPANMHKVIALLLLFFLTYHLNAQNIVWQKVIGGSHDDYPSSIKPTSDGGFIICGNSNSNTSGDKSENNWDTTLATHDYWIVKLDAAGNIQWENTIGGSKSDNLGDIIETYDGGFLIGGSSQSDSSGDKTENGCNISYNYIDYWVVKLNSVGLIEWQNTIGGCAGDVLYSIDNTSDGGYLLGGNSSSNISCDKTENNNAGINGGGYPGCGGGTSDYWIVKIDSTGSITFQKTLGRGMWASENLSSVSSTADGGFIAGGSSTAPYGNPNYGGYDYWIVKLTSNCTVQWQKVIGGSSYERIRLIKQLSDGNYILGGTSTSDTSGLKTDTSFGFNDFWILKLDTVGNIIWQKTIGGSGDDYLGLISPTFDNGFICGGTSNSPISGLKTSAGFGQIDYWILKLDSAGNIQWQRTFGGIGNDGLSAILQMANGNYIVGGSSNSGISGNKTENSKGGYDYWIFELSDSTEYNLITGKTFYDYNGNYIMDSSDIALPYKIIKDTSSNHFAFSQADGTYNLSISDTGTFTVAQQNVFYLSSSPSFHNATFTTMNQIDSLNDFATQQTVFINDLQISITPVGAFRPGSNAVYSIQYKNTGTVPLQGTIVFYVDTALSYISSSFTPQLVSSDSVVWQTPLLYPFMQGNITVTVKVKATTPVWYMVNSSAKIEPVINDTTPSNNYAACTQLTTGSYDPNDIIVDKDSINTQELISSPYLDYLIRFQNTGNDTAFNVKILNPLDTTRLDLMSFEIVASSHVFNLNYLMQEGNLEFNFENILLPDSNTNEPRSHGFVRYRIKPKTSLAVHDSITNYAAIYFDYNLPVTTNTALTRIVYPGNFVEIFMDVCDSLISPSGNYTWQSTGLYFDTIPASSGVDTIYVIHLKVNTSYSNFNAVSCENYISPSGNYVWTSSGIYSDTIPGTAGCDSIISINLTINSVDATITANSPLLYANATNAVYQWMYCDSIIIPGESNQVFLPAANSYYSVIVSQNGCTDTSLCYSVFNVGINEIGNTGDLFISPNPSSDKIVISFKSTIKKGTLTLSNALGQMVFYQDVLNESKKEINIKNISDGVYFIKFFDGEESYCNKTIVRHNLEK